MSKTYLLDTHNKQITFHFDFKDRDLSRAFAKSGLGARFSSTLNCYIIPINDWTRPKIVPFVKANGFIPGAEKKLVFEKFDYSTPDLEELSEDLNGMFTYNPRVYQIEALAYALEKGSFINADQMGLGKTFESIIYTEYINAFPCLIIVPASVKYNWKEKYEEIVGPKRSVAVIESVENKKHTNSWGADVVIINYDIIGKKQGKGATVKFDQLISIKWEMVICDEAHFLKNETAQRSKAAEKIIKRSKGIVQLLTGTPTMSKPVEIWNLLKLIDKHRLIAEDKREFDERYCNGHQTHFGWDNSGATNLLELNDKLRKVCLLRREKDEVLELPLVTKTIINTPISNSKEYQKASDNIIKYIEETKGEEAADKAMNAEALVTLSTLRQLVIDGKMKAIESYLSDWKVGGEKLVIFGIHTEPLKQLAEKFKSPILIGGLSAIKKQGIIKEWISNDHPFLFANITTAGTGVDGLQKVCSNMLFLELPWTPAELDQAISRLERSGQENHITVKFLLNRDTIDMDMYEMLSEKEFATTAANQGLDISSEESGMKSVLKKLKDKKKNVKKVKN